jgi:hypothetical protein
MQGPISVTVTSSPGTCGVNLPFAPHLTASMVGDNDRAVFKGTYKAKVDLLNARGQIVSRLLAGDKVVDGVAWGKKQKVVFAWENLQVTEAGEGYELEITAWEAGVWPSPTYNEMGCGASEPFDVLCV